MSSKILFLRHGITQGNKNRWFYGAIDIPLLEEGKQCLLDYKEQGYYPDVPENAKYYTTGLGRTEETLKLLFGDHPFQTIPELREMNFGEFEGKTFDELKDNSDFQNWMEDESGDVHLPGGESRKEFYDRIRRGLEMLLEYHRSLEQEKNEEAFSVMICHGGVIAFIMEQLFLGERESMWDWITLPGCGYVVEFERGKPVKHHQIGRLMENYWK